MSVSKHDVRRQEVAQVVMDVIARDGLEAATVRRIAREIGTSTAIVCHYFTDKQDMLLCAYRTFKQYPISHFDTVVARDPADLVGYLAAFVPTDEGSLARWRAFLAVSDWFLRDPDFAGELGRWTEQTLRGIETLMRLRNPHTRDFGKVAQRLLAIVQGVAMQMLWKPDSWSADEVRDILASDVEFLLGPAA
jgi:AcrR family transcriptional regulator